MLARVKMSLSSRRIGLRLFKKLRRKLTYLNDEQQAHVHRAYLFAHEAHKGQQRQTGEPYITHPVAVACILADMRLDWQSVVSALLHDTIEDTHVTKSDIEENFGQSVADIVDGLSKLAHIKFVSKAEAQAENFAKMILAMARDLRVIIIKLADRLHNIRTLDSLPPPKQRRIAKETLEIYAPIARRLGMRDICIEMEDLSFKARYPQRYSAISDAVQRARGHRKRVLSKINKTLSDGIVAKHLPTCVVAGREKHIYSIYRKMRGKQTRFSDVMDVYAFRIVCDSTDTCYRVLGVVHALYKPVPGRFKDYIALPKNNGYQSLHTTLFGPYGLPIEVQIRTTEMDRLANFGIAAHWRYKLKGEDLNDSQLRAEAWVNNLLEMQNQTGNSLEFLENIKVDLFPGDVYVFTPNGMIKELPRGATPVDFAYAVHTEVGNTCVAVKIDRQLAPLSQPLQNGQTIEVVTDKHATPNVAWLNFVVTSKARTHIRHFMHNRNLKDAEKLGKQLLTRAIQGAGLAKFIDDALMQQLLTEIQVAHVDQLYQQVAMGERHADVVVQQLKRILGEESPSEHQVPFQDAKGVLVSGTEGVSINFAECCQPVPGDAIVGVAKSDGCIDVHWERCRSIAAVRATPEKLIAFQWADNITQEFPVCVGVELKNERGILAKIAVAISATDAGIDDIEVIDRDGTYFCVKMHLQLQNRQHLANIIRALRSLRAVSKVGRCRDS